MRFRYLMCVSALSLAFGNPAHANDTDPTPSEPSAPGSRAAESPATPATAPSPSSPYSLLQTTISTTSADTNAPAQADVSASVAEGTGVGARLSRYRREIGSLIGEGMDYLGTPYRRGGSTEAGFDCSGLVYRVFSDALGLNLPRSSREMALVGKKVSPDNLKPGDLVFFKTVRRTISHVGIYLGNNRFLHSPASGGVVRIDDLDDNYWASHFALARRMLDDSHTPHKLP